MRRDLGSGYAPCRSTLACTGRAFGRDPLGRGVPSRYARAIGLLQGLLMLVAELTGSCLSHSATLAKPTGRALLARLWSGLQVLLQVAHLTRIEIGYRPAN